MSSKHSLDTQRFTIEQLYESQKRTIQGLSKTTISTDKITKINSLLADIQQTTNELNTILKLDNTTLNDNDTSKSKEVVTNLMAIFNKKLDDKLTTHEKKVHDYVNNDYKKSQAKIQNFYNLNYKLLWFLGGGASCFLLSNINFLFK